MTSSEAPERALIAVVGPTGSGKSALALHLCRKFQGEVVNCDSLQLYRHFDIGTAKLAMAEREGVPHHLIDVLEPDEVFTAGEFARRARPILVDISERGRLPVVVGGTGFYLRALLEGLFPGPRRDEDVRTRLSAREQRRPGSLHRLLRRFDRRSAQEIHPNDLPKIIRALEVRVLTGRPMSEWFATDRDALTGFRCLKLGLSPNRDRLYERLNQRVVHMFDGGLIDEVAGLLARGVPPEAKPFESLGYRQALQVLRGDLTVKEAIFYTQRDTRNYAKRQWTWFRSDPAVEWLQGFGDEADTLEAAAQEAVRYLTASPQSSGK
ncbi:MAG: tRNA (adenosine(37)-N6)-dimethylallyltransferase MiaA [Bryobacteraceae bacterium]